MLRLALCLGLLAVLHAAPIDDVNIYIGTGGHGWGSGSDDISAQVPFGAWRGGPDTSYSLLDIPPLDHTSGYYFEDNYVRAFSHLRLVGAGVDDFGAVGVMAVNELGNKTIVKNGFRSKFSHSSEKVTPGFYSVHLETHDIVAELVAAGSHSGLHRYTYGEKCNERVILVDAAHSVCSKPKEVVKNGSVEISPNGIVSGAILFAGGLSKRSPLGGVNIYFWMNATAADGSAPTVGVWENEVAYDGATTASSTAGSLGAYFRFNANDCGAVVVAVGISFVSIDQAKLNAEAQINGRDFEQVKVDTTEQWAKKLSIIEIGKDTDKDTRVKLTTALYHSLVAPTQATEEGGAFMGFDGLPHTDSDAHGGQLYTDMSIWDVHRTQFPLLNLLDGPVSRDIIRTFKTIAHWGGDLPKWPLANVYTGCMSGQHGFIVVADALTKGVVTKEEIAPLLPYMIKEVTTDTPHSGRDARVPYDEKGYVPCDIGEHEGASRTLEYAYDDWALSVVAAALGNETVAKEAYARSKNYKNVFSADKQFMCPRDSNGTFHCRHENIRYFLDKDKDFIEGNAWQWTWFVPQDPLGLVELFGTEESFAAKLDQCFSKSALHPSNLLPNPYYWAGNEPDLLHAWLFPFAQRPDLTQKWTRWLFEHKFANNPDGIPGNDDYGTMSAWALFAGAGFYPVSGFPYYILGSPALSAMNLTIANGNVVSIVANNWSKDALYVSSVKLNGVPLPGPIVMHDQIMGGCVLEFDMSEKPSDWGKNMDWDSLAHIWASPV